MTRYFSAHIHEVRAIGLARIAKEKTIGRSQFRIIGTPYEQNIIVAKKTSPSASPGVRIDPRQKALGRQTHMNRRRRPEWLTRRNHGLVGLARKRTMGHPMNDLWLSP